MHTYVLHIITIKNNYTCDNYTLFFFQILYSFIAYGSFAERLYDWETRWQLTRLGYLGISQKFSLSICLQFFFFKLASIFCFAIGGILMVLSAFAQKHLDIVLKKFSIYLEDKMNVLIHFAFFASVFHCLLQIL